MQKRFDTPVHRDLTPEEEKKVLQIEEQMREADERSPALMKPHLETFNDGVIAIIITIMVLELPIPSGPEAYADFIKSIGLFFVSFFIVADFWYDHHRLFESVKEADHSIVILNFLFLAVLSLIPVMTKWILAGRNSWSVVAYGSVYLVVCIIQRVLQYVSLRDRFRGFENLFLYMFAKGACMVLIPNLLLIVLGWYYPKVVMPCYLVLPVLSFLQPRSRGIRKNSEILRSVDNTSYLPAEQDDNKNR